MNYLDELNESQREAVVNFDGASMVIAGAGSGKTRVLTYRIAHMLNLGVDSFQILALTFTNKAAKEMSERIFTIVKDNDARNITMGTFHSVFAKILRIHSDKLNYPRNFSIYDTEDSRNVLKDIINDLKLDVKVYKPAAVHARISAAKNNLISPEAYIDNKEIVAEDKLMGKPLLSKIYYYYSERLKKAGAMDFDDLLFQTNVLFRDFPDVLNYYQHKFKYILVDEYQDTNYAQYLIVKKLAAVYENICVVGDDAQSIYSFRGANIENILNFKNDYLDYKLYKLEQNYRSTKNIVEAANSIIDKNKNQIKKVVWTENEVGDKIKVKKYQNDTDEGRGVADRIISLIDKNIPIYSDFVVLYRTNRQSRSLEEALLKKSIPHKIYGGISFYQRREIKDVIAYFRLIINPNDEESLKRIINYPKRGIGKTTLDQLFIFANENNLSIWELIKNINNFKIDISSSVKSKIDEFAKMIYNYNLQVEKLDAYKLAVEIVNSSNIINELHAEKLKDIEGKERYENVEELMSGIQLFVQNNKENNFLSDFLADISLLTDADNDNDDNKNKVTLMTIHSSKGLEFKNVFVVGLEENLFPSQMSLNDRKELEEERRLFYVAITRAEKNCFLSYANYRFIWGNLNKSEPSRFIYDIDDKYVCFEESNFVETKGRSLNNYSKFENFSSFTKKENINQTNFKPISQLKSNTISNKIKLKVGNNVLHDRFGKGKVIELIGSGEEKKAVIFFPQSGSKTILLRFAKLEVIDD